MCVYFYWLLIYLMHWLSRRINAKGMASSSFFFVHFIFSIYYFSSASSSPLFLSFSWILIYLLCYFLDEFGWRRCPTTDNVSVFFCLLLISQYSCICVSILSPIPKAIQNRMTREKKMWTIQRSLLPWPCSKWAHLYTVIVPVQWNKISNSFRLFYLIFGCYFHMCHLLSLLIVVYFQYHLSIEKRNFLRFQYCSVNLNSFSLRLSVFLFL